MTETLPFGDVKVPVPGFGAMGLSHGLGSNFTLEQAEPVLLKAIELGCTFWDTAVGLSFRNVLRRDSLEA
jgi:aryl-alcohol dehydrogenase-like predicted oxidoreductase